MSVSALPRPTATRDWRLHLDILVEALGRALTLASRWPVGGREDETAHDAALYELSVAGRSAERLPDAVRAHAPEVAWDALRALGDVIQPGHPLQHDGPALREVVQRAGAWHVPLLALLAEAEQLAVSEAGAGQGRAADPLAPADQPDDWDAPSYQPRTTPLRRDEALRLLREHAPELERRFGVRPVAVFGSVARDEARTDSDVDVLVEYLRSPGLAEFMGSIEYLEAVFHTRVDVGTFDTLKPRVRPSVSRDLVRVA